jgi:hypothetical protein
MRICHIAHGDRRVPPAGWGAIEALIWDTRHWCEKFGHDFYIINTKDVQEIAGDLADIKPDVVHVHCEYYFDVVLRSEVRIKIIESQWPRLYRPENATEAKEYLARDALICCVSESIRDYCVGLGIPSDRLFVLPNGVRAELFAFAKEPKYPDRSICLGAITHRKRQYLLQDVRSMDFAGPVRRVRGEPVFPIFDFRRKNYLGEWPRSRVYRELTQYANLVLVSEDEAAPLATCEALSAGLGVVVSEAAAANLDRSKPFITVVPEGRMNAVDLEHIIAMNRIEALSRRDEIRRYGAATFDMRTIVRRYLDMLQEIEARV